MTCLTQYGAEGASKVIWKIICSASILIMLLYLVFPDSVILFLKLLTALGILARIGLVPEERSRFMS